MGEKKSNRLLPLIAAAIMAMCVIVSILVSGILGGGSSMPMPAEEEQATDYQLIGNELDVNWIWVMLIDMYQSNLNGEPDLSNANPVKTALNCISVEIKVYSYEEDEFGDGDWEYEYSDYADGATEIFSYFDLPGDCKDIQTVVNAIKAKNSNRYSVAMKTADDLEAVLDTYYDFDSRTRSEIIEMYQSNYFLELYGDPFGTATGSGMGGIGDIELGDLIYPEIGMEIPLFYQYQSPWGKMKFGDGTVTTSGCSVTCISMVFSYLTDETVTPPNIIAWTGNRYHVVGIGQSWDIFTDTARQWNLTCNWLGKNMNAVLAELSAGKPVIASMDSGTFTKNGHFIVLRGITENGNILVNDPNDNASKSFFYKSFSPSLIQRESKQYWSFGN